MAQSHTKEVEALTLDLERHKQAVEKLLKKQEVLARQNTRETPVAGKSDPSEEFKKLMEKYEQLKIDYDEEKKEALKTEERHDKLRQRVEDQEEFVKQTQKDLARVEMENDELKNDVRQMGFMVDDLE